MSDFIKKVSEAQDTKHISMLGTGHEIRDFINIKDVLRAILLPLQYDKMWGEVYNVGSGRGVSIKDLLTIMQDELGTNFRVSFSGKSWHGDISGIHAINNKIRGFGFEPEIDLRTGIKEFIEAERKSGFLAGKNVLI
jgi:nucleoside-diphosphate-sugar epimerase